MQARITYLLTEEAQRAQMVATGQPVARKQVVDVDVSAEDITLFRLTEEGNLYLDYSPVHQLGNVRNSYESYSAAADHTEELHAAGCPVAWDVEGGRARRQLPLIPQYGADVVALIRRGKAILSLRVADAARQKQEEVALAHANGEYNRRITEEAYQLFLADPNARAASSQAPHIPDLQSPADWWPADHKEFRAEIQRRNKADSDARAASAAAVEQTKQDYIVAWVAEHGNELLRAQYADGLACRRIIVAQIAQTAFEKCGISESCPDSVVCDNRDCPCVDQVVDCLPTKAYGLWREIKARLPEGSSVEFRQVRDCLLDDSDGTYPGEESASEPYYVAVVTLPHGPFQFTQRIKLGC